MDYMDGLHMILFLENEHTYSLPIWSGAITTS